jgi:outer membrane protein assembly factor BamA
VNLQKIHLTVLPAAVMLCSSFVPAQTRKVSKSLRPSAFKLISIKVTGSKRYAPDELVGATGLQLGQSVSEDDFKRVSQHLGETGAFSDVVYSYQFSSAGTKLALQVTDNDQLVPARFDNIVWFSDQELLEKLRARVPLFHGQLPVAGSLADQVSDALQALLIERKIEGRADYLRAARRDDGPIEAFAFRVTGLTIHIRNVEFTGAGPAELPLLQAAASKLPSQDYLRSTLRVQADKDLLPVYLERGYLKAAFGDAQPTIVQDSAQKTAVDVTFHVDPGPQYKTTDIQFSGYKAFPVEKLRELIHQQLGQPANAVQLASDLEAMKMLYGTRGYMAMSIQTTPEMDDSQSTVKYLLQVHEGDVYKMGELEIHGLDSRATARLVERWKLVAGDPYDASYAVRFLEETRNLLPPGSWKIARHESINEKDKTVDLTLRFDSKLSQ